MTPQHSLFLTYCRKFFSHKLLISLFILLMIFQFPTIGRTETNNKTSDSLMALYNTIPKDTIWVAVCQQLASRNLFTNPDSGIYYANIGLQIATEKNYLFHTANLQKALGAFYAVKSDYTISIQQLKESLKGFQKLYKKDTTNTKLLKALSEVHTNMGLVYYFSGVYDKSIKSFINAIHYAEKNNDQKRVATCISNISNIYYELKNYNKSLEYNRKTISLASKVNDSVSLQQAFNNIGLAFNELSIPDSARYYFDKCLIITKKLNLENRFPKLYVNISNLFLRKGINDSALIYAELAYNSAIKLKFAEQKYAAKYNIAVINKNLHNYKVSEKYYLELLDETDDKGIRYKNRIENELSELYKETGNIKKAYHFLTLSYASKDSIYKEESTRQIADMEAKYKNEKKEEEIKLLHEQSKLQAAQAKANKTILISIIIILFLIIILVIISYRSYKHKQLSEKTRIQQQSERKVLDAVIETEYKERRRFAEDLHDGLGVLLSTARIYINEVEDCESDSERKELIGQSKSMVDEAITNARNISNNIMPAALKRNGLVDTLKSFSEKINISGNISIKVKSENTKKHYKSTTEITLYRILTEMINNTLKHANASLISISLIQENNYLHITYSDDGIGFDYDKMIRSSQKGSGLDNTISRVNSVGGTCTISSKTGKGFNASIKVAI